MASGVGLVARRAVQQDADVAALASDLARDVPGETHVQLFVTPAGTHGFGRHYDFEDVFIVQTPGAKDCYFRANTVDRDASTLRVALLRQRRDARGRTALIPGDVPSALPITR